MKYLQKFILLLIVAAMIAIPAGSAFAGKKIRWKLAMTWSSTMVPISNAAPRLAELVKEMTGGNFEIRVEGSEKHKAPFGILDMVKGGQYQMGHSASYYWKGKDITTIFFTTAPFGMTSEEQFCWLLYNGGLELQQKIYNKFGVYSLPGGSTGVQMGGWFRKEIKSLDDLNGLKMRIPGLAGEVFAKLGVNVTNIPPGELYTALDRGTIDAIEWVGPAMDIKMGFHKITPYYYAGWHEPASDTQFLINQKAFNKLPKEYQAILKTAIQRVNHENYAENVNANIHAWAKMKEEHPEVKVMVFPEPVLKAMKKATDEVMAEYGAKNPGFMEVYKSQQDFIKKARPWTTRSLKYYLEASELVGVGAQE
ncbi:MAG: ABC transporter substrate-binding protein [Desulfobacterales bacterium]|nr:MAG: ABC transporter substrate-binding protein [Desulfobacterales bacterium]